MGRPRLLLLIGTLLMGNALWGSIFEVCPSCPIKSIKEGVAAASAYDTVSDQKGNL